MCDFSLPIKLITDESLKPRDVQVFAYLLNASDGDIERDLRMTTKKVNRSIRRLVAANWLRVSGDQLLVFQDRKSALLYDVDGMIPQARAS